jgi:DNA polymerase II small subunit
MNEEVLAVIREKGLLLEREIFDLIEGFENVGVAKYFLEQLERVSGQKIITKKILNTNVEYVKEFLKQLPGEDKNYVERVFINLGISLELRREKEIIDNVGEKKVNQKYQVFYADTKMDKKLEVKDFTNLFRMRFNQLRRMLMMRPELQHNLVSISKISSDRTAVAIIGIVKEKRVTKNKNLIISLEDLTGEIKTLAKFDSEEIFAKAEELQLDDVVGMKASGNRDILFIHDIFFPDVFLYEKTKFDSEICVAFLSDVHCGSDRHLGESFEKFLMWMNSDEEIVKKIKYIFFTGDNVDGVGIFPGQENALKLKSMEEQYKLLASYLRRIPEHITIFMCPGQHDAVRVAEPQPLISKKYASELYEIENLVLVTNPAMVKILEDEKLDQDRASSHLNYVARQREFKVLMYHGASIHTFINEVKELREMKAHSCPAKAVRHMLKRRHLAPMYGVSPQIVYVPNSECDPLVISEVPDILVTGEVHRADIENYNGVLIVTGSCWQSQTPFEEKVGNVPVPGKVPVLNLKTRELKVFDFLEENRK